MCGVMGLAGLKKGGIKGALGASLGGLAGLALTRGKDKAKPAPTAATGNMAAL